MRRLIISIIVGIAIFSIITCTSVSRHSAYGDRDYAIPLWIKDNAKLWSEGKISDSEYISAIQYLMQHGWMKITSIDDDEVVEKTKIQNKNCLDKTFPKVDWDDCDFSGVNLQDAELKNSNLTNANFHNANLHSTDLGGTILTGAKLDCIGNPICHN